MPDGSRARTGCITCRIRKKKCDEQRPVCQACRSRQLTCYGYNEPAPKWYTSKANWKEVRESDEAKNLQTLAGTRYKIRRKVPSTEGTSSILTASTQSREQNDDHHHLQLETPPAMRGANTALSSNTALGGANIWQLRPDTIWWDSKMRSLAPGSNASNEETRLLMLYVDVIHPISYSFYKLDSSRARSWMFDRLVSNKALYNSALSISASFDHSLTQPLAINDIGICPKVRSLQSTAVRELQNEVERFVSMESTPLEAFIRTGIQLLDVISNLEALEIFSMLQGYWEMHHRAARKILNHLEICVSSKLRDGTKSKASLVEAAFSIWPTGSERRRSLEFCITTFIWIDALAISTFGPLSYDPCAFDYLNLLESETVKPQIIMGCQGWIMAKVVEIARLEEWKVQHQNRMHLSHIAAELFQRDREIADKLKCGIDKLERDHSRREATALEEDSRLISILWAYGAQVFRQMVMFDLEHSSRTSIDQTFVNACLEKLEQLPTRLTMRCSWPYTITGCMSISESQHQRFRRILSKTMEEAQPPGIAWKGLIVMEECWKLRQIKGNGWIGWREAMERLGARVILT